MKENISNYISEIESLLKQKGVDFKKSTITTGLYKFSNDYVDGCIIFHVDTNVIGFRLRNTDTQETIFGIDWDPNSVASDSLDKNLELCLAKMTSYEIGFSMIYTELKKIKKICSDYGIEHHSVKMDLNLRLRN